MWNSDEDRRLNHLADHESIFQQSLFKSRELDGIGWFGTGETNVVVDEDAMKGLLVGERLGQGAHGAVKALTYNSLTMARKKIKSPSNKTLSSDDFKEERDIMKKLSHHHHFVKLAGTYSLVTDPKLYILTFPVAICTLDRVLEDYEQLRKGALRAMDAKVVAQATVGSASARYMCGLKSGGDHKILDGMAARLDQAMGCLATAVQWMHAKNIRHLDLKPLNVVLNAGELYITDFDLSRDLLERNTTITEMYRGHTTGYSAPEIERQSQHSPAAADVYSLGCIHLHITAVRYGSSRVTCRAMLNHDITPREFREAAIDAYLNALIISGIVPGAGEKRSTRGFKIPHLELIRKMLRDSQDCRPSASGVNDSLQADGHFEQKYHGKCCTKDRHALSLAGFIREEYQQEVSESDSSVEGYLAIALHRQRRHVEDEARLRGELERRELSLGPDHDDTLVCITYLAECLEDQGKHAAAHLLRQRVLRTKRRTLRLLHPDTIRCMKNLGLALSRRGLNKTAADLMDETLKFMADALGNQHSETVQTLNELACIQRVRRKFKEAEEMLREVLYLKQKSLGRDYGGTLDTMYHLCLVLFDQEKYESAKTLTVTLLALQEKTLGSDHPKTLETMRHLVDILRHQGEEEMANETESSRMLRRRGLRRLLWSEDSAVHRYIRDNTRQSHGMDEGAGTDCPTHSDEVLPVNENAGNILHSMDRTEKAFRDQSEFELAEEQCRQALEIREQSLSYCHPATLDNRDRLAEILCQQERYDDSQKILRQNLKLISKVTNGSNASWRVLVTQQHLAELLFKAGNMAEAEDLFRKILDSRSDKADVEHRQTLAAKHGLANALAGQRKYKEAQSLFEQTLESQSRTVDHAAERLHTLSSFGYLLREMELLPEAEKISRQALEGRESSLGPVHPSTLDSMHQLALVLHDMGRFQDAEKLCRDTMERTERVHGKEHPRMLATMDALAHALSRRHKYMEAGEIYRQAIRITRRPARWRTSSDS